MSLKAELERWVKALQCYDAQDYQQALSHFGIIADSSKILFNMGIIHATKGEHSIAVKYFEQAHALDQYLAVSFFQSGVSHFLLGQFNLAADNFHNAYYHMRENQIIDYEQIGLKFRLYTAEILFNEGLAYLNMGQQNQGMQLLDQARKEKQTEEHNLIDEAFNAYGRNFTVFSVPVGTVFRPSPIKVKNLKAKDYLGSAKLVAATEAIDAFVGFSGIGARAATSTATAEETHPRMTDTESSLDFVAPLRLDRKNSSVDLKVKAAAAAVPSLPPVPAPRTLPPINTNVPRPTIAAAYMQHSRTISAKIQMPPSPPDSEPGGRQRADYLKSKRTSSETTLGYLNRPASRPEFSDKRDTAFMEELVGGYSAAPDKSTQFDQYEAHLAPPLPVQSNDRVAAWANKQAIGVADVDKPRLDPNARVGLNKMPSTRSAGNMGTLRRRAATSPVTRTNSEYIDTQSLRTTEMVSFRLKLHFENDIRGMSLDAETPWAVFYGRLQSKFGIADMSLKYKDEDGTLVTIADEDDWDSAIDAAREHCPPGRQDGKLDIWIVEN